MISFWIYHNEEMRLSIEFSGDIIGRDLGRVNAWV